MDATATVRDYFDALVHPAAAVDTVVRARHRVFIAARLIGATAVLALLPFWLVWHATLTPVDASLLVWVVAQVCVAVLLSRTGHFALAHAVSALSVAALAVALAVSGGGAVAAAFVWLAVIVLEATLARSRSLVAGATMVALVTAVGLTVADAAGLFPASTSPVVLDGTAMLALLWATLLAVALASLQSTADDVIQGSEARYALLAANMTDVITCHAPSGAVTFVSPAAERLTGAPLSTLVGQGLFDRVHVADRPAYLTALAEAGRRGAPVSVEFRLRMRDADGVEDLFVWVEMRCRPIAGPSGQASDIVAVLRDVSERKSNDTLLERARAEAVQASQAKTRFLAVMSHELRTPLNAIIGFSDMLANEEILRIDQPRRLEYARLINDSGQHLLSVVNGLLDMSKIETGKFELVPEPMEIGPVILRTIEILGLKAREGGVALAADIAPDLPDMVADRRALTQVMINLLSNAVKFTRPGGRVDVAVTREDDRIRIDVADTGIGIAADDVGRLGDPFFQARNTYDRPYEGTGLGLSVVKGLIDLHGGRMAVDSEVGRGTRVTIRLPLDCEKVAPVRMPEPIVVRADFQDNGRFRQSAEDVRRTA
jgi:cell cycle sensor histidine kinase DivJ